MQCNVYKISCIFSQVFFSIAEAAKNLGKITPWSPETGNNKPALKPETNTKNPKQAKT